MVAKKNIFTQTTRLISLLAGYSNHIHIKQSLLGWEEQKGQEVKRKQAHIMIFGLQIGSVLQLDH